MWAPNAKQIELVLLSSERRCLPMQAEGDGYYSLAAYNIPADTRYQYRLDGSQEAPDPASRFQPDGAHGPSQVVERSFAWTDENWRNHALGNYVIYELHVGTFTAEGTFEAVIAHLDDLKALGVTAVELMPVGQFPGARDWGYDGVLPFAAQNTYGGPHALKSLINACHERELAVVLDVVYNHLGPEGNYLSQFGPYFTEQYKSPWGLSINFDGAESDHVRRFFLENALYWLEDFHVDALRLDATHGYLDFSAYPFIEELTSRVAEWADQSGRRVYLIAENDRNDVRLLRTREAGGIGIDAQWLDELHHCIHVHLTGDTTGYYADFTDPLPKLAKCLRDGFVFSGEHSPFRKRRHGTSSRGIPGSRFVVSVTNHDQVGNRMLGERLGSLTDINGLKLAAGLVLLSPYIPLIFMGEEYGESAPFLFFTDYGDPEIIEGVRKGRKEEFAYFAHQGEAPDPQAESTFSASKLNRALRDQDEHSDLLVFYKSLLTLRKSIPALRNDEKDDLDISLSGSSLIMERRDGESAVVAIFNLDLETSATVQPVLTAGVWEKRLESVSTSSAERLDTRSAPSLDLPPKSFVVYERSAT